MGLEIKILGNGGCLNKGLPHNAFLVDGRLLAEAPPDIMNSLNTHGIRVETIDSVFVSHLHGDHTFGLPFLIINQWFHSIKAGAGKVLTITGPKGVREHVHQITGLAFKATHPCMEWLKNKVVFREIDHRSETRLNANVFSYFKLDHVIDTYGFLIATSEKKRFAYIADTRWCPQVERVLKLNPEFVLMDMNGGEIHISPDEVIEKGLPLIKKGTVICGTHLSDEFTSARDALTCAKPGELIVI